MLTGGRSDRVRPVNCSEQERGTTVVVLLPTDSDHHNGEHPATADPEVPT